MTIEDKCKQVNYAENCENLSFVKTLQDKFPLNIKY